MTGTRRALWRRYVDDLYVTPKGSAEREIADTVTGLAVRAEIHAYLDDLMRRHPEKDRRHEVAWEMRHLMTGVTV